MIPRLMSSNMANSSPEMKQRGVISRPATVLRTFVKGGGGTGIDERTFSERTLHSNTADIAVGMGTALLKLSMHRTSKGHASSSRMRTETVQ